MKKTERKAWMMLLFAAIIAAGLLVARGVGAGWGDAPHPEFYDPIDVVPQDAGDEEGDPFHHPAYSPEALFMTQFHQSVFDTPQSSAEPDLVGTPYPGNQVFTSGPADQQPPPGEILLGNGSLRTARSTDHQYDVYQLATMRQPLPLSGTLVPILNTTDPDFVTIDRSNAQIGVTDRERGNRNSGPVRFFDLTTIDSAFYDAFFVFITNGKFGTAPKKDLAILDREPRICWPTGAESEFLNRDDFGIQEYNDGNQLTPVSISGADRTSKKYCGKVWLLSNTTAGGNNPSFAKITNSIPVGLNPARAAVCDMNNDGIEEVIVTNAGAHTEKKNLAGSISIVTTATAGNPQVRKVVDINFEAAPFHPYQVVAIPRGNSCDFAVSFFDSDKAGQGMIRYYKNHVIVAVMENSFELQEISLEGNNTDLDYVLGPHPTPHPVALEVLPMEIPVPNNPALFLENPKISLRDASELLLAVGMNRTRNVAFYRIQDGVVQTDARTVVTATTPNLLWSGPKLVTAGLANLIKPGMHSVNARRWLNYGGNNLGVMAMKIIFERLVDRKVDLAVISAPPSEIPEKNGDLNTLASAAKQPRDYFAAFNPLSLVRGGLGRGLITEAEAGAGVGSFFRWGSQRDRVQIEPGFLAPITNARNFEMTVIEQTDDICANDPVASANPGLLECCRKQLVRYPPVPPTTPITDNDLGPTPPPGVSEWCRANWPNLSATVKRACVGERIANSTLPAFQFDPVKCDKPCPTKKQEFDILDATDKTRCCTRYPEYTTWGWCAKSVGECDAIGNDPKTIWDETACCAKTVEIRKTLPVKDTPPFSDDQNNQINSACCAGYTDPVENGCCLKGVATQTTGSMADLMANPTLECKKGEVVKEGGTEQRIVFILPEASEAMVPVKLGGPDGVKGLKLQTAVESGDYTVGIKQLSGFSSATKANEVAKSVSTEGVDLTAIQSSDSPSAKATRVSKKATKEDPVMEVTFIGQRIPEDVLKNNVTLSAKEMGKLGKDCYDADSSGDPTKIQACVDALGNATAPKGLLLSQYEMTLSSNGEPVHKIMAYAGTPPDFFKGSSSSGCSGCKSSLQPTPEELAGQGMVILFFLAGFGLMFVRRTW